MDLRDIQRRGFDEFVEYVNPFVAQRAMLAQEPIRLVRTDDGRLVDADGRVIEDFHGTQMLGHRHPAITKAAQDFLATDAPNWYPSRVSPQAGRFARLLCERTGYSAAFFTCTGSDAVEAAIKLGRALTRRPGVLALEGAYHGCAIGATALMHDGPFRDPFGPHLPGARKIPFGDPAALARELERGDVGTVIVEPIQGEGGDRHASAGFFRSLRALLTRYEAAFIVDEVQTSVGATGTFWAHEQWSLDEPPDVVTWSKKFQLGGLHLHADFMPAEAWRLFNTFLGDPFRAAQFEVIANVIERDALIAHTRRTGELLVKELESLCERFPGLFAQARGKGTFAAIDVRDAATRDRMLDMLRQIGLEAGGSGERSVRFRPALVFGPRHVGEVLDRFETVAREIA